MNEIQMIIEDIRYLVARNKISEALLLLETLQAWIDAKVDSAEDETPERKVFFIEINNGSDPTNIKNILDTVKSKMESNYFFEGKASHSKQESVMDEIQKDISKLFKDSGLGD